MNGEIYLTDAYYYTNGAYEFRWDLFDENHERNFTDSLSGSVPVVVCDNVNRRHGDYKNM
ncbi:MAG: hypothetical protein Q8Q18_00540 [bacterium]|nr:hypothetical protein [bacterium]